MIHRESRNHLALTLRQYVSGRVTNYELDSVEVDWRDRGAVAVQHATWFLYHDTHQHKATGRNRLNSTQRKEVARCILFLHSDKEYLWPEYSFPPLKNVVLNILTLGWWNTRQATKWAQYKESGDIDVWPFISHEEFQHANESTRYLASGCA